MDARVIALSLCLAGCATSHSRTQADPTTPPKAADDAAPEAAPIADPELYFDVNEGPFFVGETPRIRLNRGRSMPDDIDATVEVVLVKPDRTSVSLEVHVGATETTALCLPAGPEGCEHGRSSDPFWSVNLEFWTGEVVFDQVGTYRLELVDPARKLGANPVEIVVSEDRAAALLSPAKVGDFTLSDTKVERVWSPDGYAHVGTYLEEGRERVEVAVYELTAREGVREMIEDVTRPHVKRGLKPVEPIGEVPRWGSTDRTSHFLRWGSGVFVITIYAPNSSTSDVALFVERFRERYP